MTHRSPLVTLAGLVVAFAYLLRDQSRQQRTTRSYRSRLFVSFSVSGLA